MKEKKNSFLVSKRLVLLMAALACLLLCGNAVAVEEEGTLFTGEGTRNAPYQISSYEDLALLRDQVDLGNTYQNSYFEQTQDIVFPEGINWNPIGDLHTGKVFSGIYNGKGHTLSNVICEDSFAGLFSLLDGEVRNLGIESGRFSGDTIGSITSHGTVNAKIVNCYNKAEVTGTSRAGGITDNYAGKIYFCWNFGTVTGLREDAILAGITSYGSAEIHGCVSTQQVDLIHSTMFSGNITESEIISEADMAAAMERMYDRMLKDYRADGLIAFSNTKFPIYNNGEMFFFDGLPENFAWEKDIQKVNFQQAMDGRYAFSGEGTEEEPFQITSYEELCQIQAAVAYGVTYKGYHFVQTQDLVFPEGVNWGPIGDVKKGLSFQGVYDGQGHTVSNIICEDPFAGLFSLLDGEVRNLGIESGRFSGDTIGSITSHGTVNAKIINCYNKAEVAGINRAGGIADNFSGKIYFCWNFGEVTGSHEGSVLAGIVSYGAADLQYCFSAQELPLIHKRTFSGTITESDCITETEISEVLDQVSQGLREFYLIGDEETTLEGIVPVDYQAGELFFGEGSERKDFVWDYSAELFLIGSVVVFAAFFLLKKGRTQNAVNGNPEKAVVRAKAAVQNEQIAEEPELRKKRTMKRVVAVVLTGCMFVGVYSYLSQIFRIEYEAGVLNMDYYQSAEIPPDVLFLGSSTMSCNIEQATLWSEYGIAGFCLGAGGSSMWDNYYRLLEAEKTHTPQLVVMDVYGVTSAEDYRVAEFKQENITGVDFSMNKFRYIQAAVEPELRMEYLLNLPVQHTRYTKLEKQDFLHYSSVFGKDDKGTWTIMYQNHYMPELSSTEDVVEYKALPDKSEYYLHKIITYCKENDIDLLLLKTPNAGRKEKQPYFNTVQLIADMYEVPFLNMNYYDTEIGLETTDFYKDDVHLTVFGARKCSLFLGRYLRANYQIPDRRGDEVYQSWNRFVANRELLIQQQINNDNKAYFSELEKNGKQLYAISYKPWMSEKNEAYLAVKTQLDELGCKMWESEMEDDEPLEEIFKLGENEVVVAQSFADCQITINEEEYECTVKSPGLILFVYDQILDEVVDVVSFTQASGYNQQRLIVTRKR